MPLRWLQNERRNEKIKFEMKVDLYIFNVAEFDFKGNFYIRPLSAPPQGVSIKYCLFLEVVLHL